MAQDYDVVIVGAGLIGASLALQLASQNQMRIAVLERGSQVVEHPSPNQRVVALGGVARAILSDIGVFPQLAKEFCHAYRDMHVWDENSNGVLHFSSQEQGYPQLGHMVDSNECVRLLHRQMLANSAIDVIFDLDLVDLSLDQGVAHLCTGQEQFTAKLVVGADGARSWVRQRAKIFANHESYEQQGIVALIRTQLSHEDTAWQRFLSTGPIAVLPLADNQSSIVWSATNSRAKELMELGDLEFSGQLELALESKLGQIQLLSNRAAFPLQSLKAEIYVRRNLALVGDAAHSIHPLAGQGANLGFKDIQCLCELILDADSNNLGDLRLLATYQRRRQFDNRQTDSMMTGLHNAYINNAPVWMMARGVGMNFMSNSKLIKQFLVSQAVGS